MMFLEYLYGVSEWILFAFVILVLCISVELAFLYGRHVADRHDDGLSDRVSDVGGTLLGSLALLIGFTFSMALSRFDARKDAFQKEVNDIGSAYDLAALLPDQEAAESRELLGKYVEQRVHLYWWERTVAESARINQETDVFQTRLWDIAVKAVKDGKVSVVYLNNLSATFDNRTARSLALGNHVPEAVIWLLLFFALAAMATTGYASGLKKARAPFVRLVLILTIALTILVIVDLDRPRRGLIRIDQRAMAELRDDILAKNRAAGLQLPAIPADEILVK